jgi:hypothetical protein
MQVKLIANVKYSGNFYKAGDIINISSKIDPKYYEEIVEEKPVEIKPVKRKRKLAK